MSNILDDEFTGSGLVTAHTSDSGHTWADTGGAFWAIIANPGDTVDLSLSSGAAVNTSVSGRPAVASSVLLPAACFVEAHLVGTNVQNGLWSIACRYNTAGGAGYYVVNNGGDSTHVNVDVTGYNGSSQDFPIGAASYAVVNGNDFVVRLEMSGSSVTLKLNGTTVATGTSTNYSSGGAVAFFLAQGTLGNSGQCAIDYIHAGSLIVPAFWTNFVETTEVDV